VILAYMAINQVSEMNRDLGRLANERLSAILLAARMQNNYQNTARTLRNMILTQDPGYLKQEKEKHDRADTQLTNDSAEIEKINLLPETRDVLVKIRAAPPRP
jgi:uncharacterized protein (DUF2141 family)